MSVIVFIVSLSTVLSVKFFFWLVLFLFGLLSRVQIFDLMAFTDISLQSDTDDIISLQLFGAIRGVFHQLLILWLSYDQSYNLYQVPFFQTDLNSRRHCDLVLRICRDAEFKRTRETLDRRLLLDSGIVSLFNTISSCL